MFAAVSAGKSLDPVSMLFNLTTDAVAGNTLPFLSVYPPALLIYRPISWNTFAPFSASNSKTNAFELDDLLSRREKINKELQEIIDEQTDPWGVKVSTVEIKDVELPQTMQRAMAKQAEAERERRAKIINAEGEFQASEKLSDAARVLSEFPVSVQLRFLQTLREIATEQNSTIVFPVPIDFIQSFLDKVGNTSSNSETKK